MKRKKSWQEKLADSKGLPKVAPMDGRMLQRYGPGTMVIPAPKDVDAVMRQVPPGKLITVNEIRAQLSRKNDADVTCPLTTGIFAWIAAHAAAEAAAEGEPECTPYWRTLKSGGEVNAKYPGGLEEQRRRLEAEGHRLVTRGQRMFVADFESRLSGGGRQ